MSYQDYPPAGDLLIGYDPNRDMNERHLARLIDRVVDEVIVVEDRPVQRGREPFNPKLLIKVLLLGYSTGVRSSRQMEKQCCESLPYLFLTRGAKPSYRTLCTARIELADKIDECWVALFAVAATVGIKRVGRVDVDSTKIRADISGESVIKAEDLDRFRQVLAAILTEVQQQDALEGSEGYTGQSVLDRQVGTDQMREVIRKIRQCGKDDPQNLAVPKDLHLGKRMVPQLKKAVKTIEKAIETGQKHVSLTDPDAQIMGEGRIKTLQECHSLDVAVDGGLIVAAETSQSAADNNKLVGLVNQANEHETDGVKQVVADCGFYRGEALLGLEKQGITTCVPDPWTACDIRKGVAVGSSLQSARCKVSMSYDVEADCYRCPQNNVLLFQKLDHVGDQTFRVYRAANSCAECPIRTQCMQNNKATRRMLRIGNLADELRALLERFDRPEHQRRYHDRGKNVETVFAFCRTVLKITRWMVRGSAKVKAEAKLIVAAYQFRKIQTAITSAALPKGRRQCVLCWD